MAKATWLLFGVVVVSACGGRSPTSPEPSPQATCAPLQCLIDGTTFAVTVNGVIVPNGSTQTVAPVPSISINFTYVNFSGQNVWLGFRLVRDDGLERFIGCLGLGGAFTTGGGNLNFNVTPNDTMFTSGHTVRVNMVGRFGPSPSEGACALRTSTGEFDPTVVQGQRLVVTFAIQ